MRSSDRYIKVVEWSEEDQCYIGRCPGLMLGGIHGMDERKVYKELCQVVDEWIEIHQEENISLPRATIGRRYSGRVLVQIGKDLHERIALRAASKGKSVTRYCRDVLERSSARQ
ncbi:MAG: toxin-antitoxin system HicB family antitoxin [Candidatus Sumerlaeota bacterium]|nr:toxin-antitoxin system HicB family antitoxin [Candidatus Sumerlaeota bacterium]